MILINKPIEITYQNSLLSENQTIWELAERNNNV